MRLFVGKSTQFFAAKSARRVISFIALLLFSVPFGLTVSGCKHALTAQYCNGGDSGPEIGQVAALTISQSLATYGESLNYGQIGQFLSASATDCKGNSVSATHLVFASTNGYTAGAAPGTIYADINPTTGQVCAGLWNRFTGGGVADYTTCTASTVPPSNYLAYVTATAEGATSNAIPVFIHAVPNSIQIGAASPAGCTASSPNPSSNCCPLTYTAAQPTTTYDQQSCISQGQTTQLVARVFDVNNNNITCQVGHLIYNPVNSTNIVSIDENGVATAAQPGSATITASISGSGSSSTAGYFSTCPPASISLTSNGSSSPIAGNINVVSPFTTVVTDSKGATITGLELEFESTTPQTIVGGSNLITPTFPGAATITAVCQPPVCNPSAFSQIDYLGNGTPLTSNGVQITATGPSSTVLYIGSTSSQYIYPIDFTTNQTSSLLKLPYVPNSMVINSAGNTIYLGSSQALMTVSATANSVTSANTNVVGVVIAISPDGSTLVVTDPTRQTTSIVSAGGGVETLIGGVAARAAWSPDSQTVYITTNASASYGPQLLVHSQFTSWTATPLTTPYADVTVTVPHIGAYAAGINGNTNGISFCPTNTLGSGSTPPPVTNNFYPVAQNTALSNEKIASTNDGQHILGALPGTPTNLNDLATGSLPYQAPCPIAPTPAPPAFAATNTQHTLTGITATDITGVDPASNSQLAFVTFTGTSTTPGSLPAYFPGLATVSNFQLSTYNNVAPGAPIFGVFSSDNAHFFVSTTGDNSVHQLSLFYSSANALTNCPATLVTNEILNTVACVYENTAPVVPQLPDINGNIVTPNLLVQRVKKPTT